MTSWVIRRSGLNRKSQNLAYLWVAVQGSSKRHTILLKSMWGIITISCKTIKDFTEELWCINAFWYRFTTTTTEKLNWNELKPCFARNYTGDYLLNLGTWFLDSRWSYRITSSSRHVTNHAILLRCHVLYHYSKAIYVHIWIPIAHWIHINKCSP